jgi:hypothetical protein
MMIGWLCHALIFLGAILTTCGAVADQFPAVEHPRLYFQAVDLPALRALRKSGVHAQIWRNLTESADWCAQQPIRSAWIPTIADDPKFENLYDRFYGAMHDTAIVEHLAFVSALSDPESDCYFDAARGHLLATARIWKAEAQNAPDASKAYAVLRVIKALAVGYDVLHARLTADERGEVVAAITAVADAYYEFFQEPSTAGAGYNKHHGSVDAAPLGIIALAMLGEVEHAQNWLDVAVAKHVDYLLPFALTPSGTNDQSSNFWASTLQYRILFLDPLRRVTGRDLFAEFPRALPGRIALAAIAAGQPLDLQFNEDNRSVLFAPSYGQINYWSPVLLFLARHERRPIYQHLALWDESLGSIQRTRYVTPNRKEELLFTFGPYAYLWYDPSVEPAVEKNLPYSFEFPEPEVNEAYMRASYDRGGLVVGMKKGGLIVHAGGRPVLVDKLPVADINTPAEPAKELLVADDGCRATIRSVGPDSAGFGEQLVDLDRPSRLAIHRTCRLPVTWWHAGDAQRSGQSITWPDGTRLTVTKGAITGSTTAGHVDRKSHYGGMQYADPHPFTYPTTTVEPADGVIAIEITTPPQSGEDK